MLAISEEHKLFLDDVRDKKRTASGVHSKTGKRGYVGKMRFPSDIMSRKDKMKHRRAGKVMTTNIFDTILPMDEFKELEVHEKKNRMQYWRANNTIKKIQEEMGISNYDYYLIIDELELPKNRVSSNAGKKRTGNNTNKKAKTPKAPKEEQSVAIQPTAVAPAKQQQDVVQEVIVNGLNIIFNGTYSAEKIEKQLTKFMLLLDGEEDDFYVEMKLMQKSKR
jgi:hypothetical protein